MDRFQVRPYSFTGAIDQTKQKSDNSTTMMVGGGGGLAARHIITRSSAASEKAIQATSKLKLLQTKKAAQLLNLMDKSGVGFVRKLAHTPVGKRVSAVFGGACAVVGVIGTAEKIDRTCSGLAN